MREASVADERIMQVHGSGCRSCWKCRILCSRCHFCRSVQDRTAPLQFMLGTWPRQVHVQADMHSTTDDPKRAAQRSLQRFAVRCRLKSQTSCLVPCFVKRNYRERFDLLIGIVGVFLSIAWFVLNQWRLLQLLGT